MPYPLRVEVTYAASSVATSSTSAPPRRQSKCVKGNRLTLRHDIFYSCLVVLDKKQGLIFLRLKIYLCLLRVVCHQTHILFSDTCRLATTRTAYDQLSVLFQTLFVAFCFMHRVVCWRLCSVASLLFVTTFTVTTQYAGWGCVDTYR